MTNMHKICVLATSGGAAAGATKCRRRGTQAHPRLRSVPVRYGQDGERLMLGASSPSPAAAEKAASPRTQMPSFRPSASNLLPEPAIYSELWHASTCTDRLLKEQLACSELYPCSPPASGGMRHPLPLRSRQAVSPPTQRVSADAKS